MAPIDIDALIADVRREASRYAQAAESHKPRHAKKIRKLAGGLTEVERVVALGPLAYQLFERTEAHESTPRT